MKSVCLVAPGKLEVRELPKPEIKGPGDVLVRVKSCGICGSDVHYFREGRIGSAACKYPHYLGHEPAGVVEESFKGSRFKRGDRVAIEPWLSCGECEWCKSQRFNLCPKVAFLASPGIPGAFQEHLLLKESQLARFPEHLSFDEAAMLEPLGIAYHMVVELAEIQFGQTVAVFGAGPIGLLALAMAKYCGAGAAYISDPLDYRLQFAENHCGADGAIDPSNYDVPESILELTSGRGVDITIDAAGTQQSIDHAFASVVIGGRTLLAGIPESDAVSYNPHTLRRKELQVINVRRSNMSLEPCVSLMENNCFDLKPYVTHHFSLDRIAEAFDIVSNYKDGIIKAMVNP